MMKEVSGGFALNTFTPELTLQLMVDIFECIFLEKMSTGSSVRVRCPLKTD